MLATVEAWGRTYSDMVGEVFRTGLGSLAVTLAFLLGGIMLLAVRGFGKKHLPKYQPFAFYTVPRFFGLAMLVALVIFLIAETFNAMWLPVLSALQMLFGCAYSLQGLAVLLFMLKKRSVGRGGLAAIAVVILLAMLSTPMIITMLSMVGVLETFLQLRLRASGSK
jgi:hypothetical protein